MVDCLKVVEHDLLYNKRQKDNKDSVKRDRDLLELSKHVDEDAEGVVFPHRKPHQV